MPKILPKARIDPSNKNWRAHFINIEIDGLVKFQRYGRTIRVRIAGKWYELPKDRIHLSKIRNVMAIPIWLAEHHKLVTIRMPGEPPPTTLVPMTPTEIMWTTDYDAEEKKSASIKLKYARIWKRTDKALEIRFEQGEVCWFPKSLTTLDEENETAEVPEWIAKKRGLTKYKIPMSDTTHNKTD